jgi:WD40 repeat protein
LSGGHDGRICLWDHRVARPTFALSLRDPAPVTSILCPSSDLFISGDNRGGIVVWDIRSQSQLLRLPLRQTDARTPVVGAALAPDARQMAAVFLDGSIVVHSLDGNWGHVVHTWRDVGAFYTRCCFSPCGAFLVTGSVGGAICIFPVGRTADPVVALGHSAAATSVDWCRDAFDYIVSCSDDRVIQLWQAEYRKTDAEQPEHEMLPVQTGEAKDPPAPHRVFTLHHFVKLGE